MAVTLISCAANEYQTINGEIYPKGILAPGTRAKVLKKLKRDSVVHLETIPGNVKFQAFPSQLTSNEL